MGRDSLREVQKIQEKMCTNHCVTIYAAVVVVVGWCISIIRKLSSLLLPGDCVKGTAATIHVENKR
jgi:hypothetical protein